MKIQAYLTQDRTGVKLWKHQPVFNRKLTMFTHAEDSEEPLDGHGLFRNLGASSLLGPNQCIVVNLTRVKKVYDYFSTPEGKLLKSIFKNRPTSKAQKSTKGIKTPPAPKNSLLFIHAMDRKEQLQPMVDMLSADKYFPNEKYLKVFQWALMEAAQWQYEQIMNQSKTESKPLS